MAAEGSETLVTIKDACQVIDSLNIGMTIPPSLQPPVELHHFSIAYWPNSDQSYENPASIMIALAELNKEIEIQKKVVQYLDEAQEHAKNLYTWRSLMRLFVMGRPNLTERNDENKAALTSCLQVMEPEIRKAFQLYKYHQDAAKFLAGEIYKFSQSLVKGDDSRPGANKNFYSETCLVTMGKMLGSFVALDNLICFNAAFRNDFAEYNRTLIKAKNAGVAPNNVEEDQKLGEMKMFFAQKTPLQDALFKYLQELDQQAGVGSGLIINFFKKLILTCADNFGKGKFVMPSEKEDYLKIISCCLKFIMRSEKKFESNNQIFSKCFKDEEKKQIIRCFKSISVLKDFGDVPIDENQLLFDMTGKGSDKQNSLHERLQEFERDHGTIVCRIMDLVRNYNLMTERAMRLQADDEFENYLDNAAKQWYDVAVRALKCLENITGAILSLYAWKLCHGKALDDDTITSYSKVTRYNYDAEEKTDMTIAIGLAKGLQNVMIKYEEIFSFLIGRHCFSRLHDVIDRVIPELADKIKDKHRMTCRMFIDTLVKVAKKFKNPYRIPNAHSSMASSGNKKSGGKKGGAAPQPEADPSPVGAVGPGNTQLYMIRSMLEWLCSSDQIKLYKRAPDLSAALRDFHEETFHWSYVLNLTSIIPKAGDMSIMWFRESYLTMEVAKANPDPQFGLNESMPWILAEHLLESDTGAGALIEHCLIPFELYNDSAEAVLKFFRKQHLFDELEAETSLGFEQLINWLYTHVFENTIERALFQYAVSHAPKQLRSSGLGEPRKLNCAWLLQQSNIIMLGQTIDLRERLVSRFAAMLREELATIFVRFKNSSYSFTYIWEAFTKIEIMRVAHSFLIEDIALPDFDTLVVEAKATALSDNQSFFHLMVKKLEFSVFPMFNFDLASGSGYLNPDLWRSLTSYKNEEGKWICPPVPEYKLRAANKKATFCVNASEYTEKLFTKVVAPVFAHKFYTLTDEHYRALVKLLSLEEIALLVKECSRVIIDNFAKTEVSGMFSTQPIPSVLFTLLQLRSGMKSSECKLQPNLVQTKAQIVRIHESFCPIILYQDFDYLIEGLTEVGNGMIFLYHLEKIVNTEEARNNVASAMFTNRFNQQKFINLIGRGRFMEIKKMNIAKLGRDPDPETERRIEQHANESTTGYVHLKVDLMNRSNIFNYIDPEQSRLPSLLQETLSVPETTSSFFGKLLFDLQQTLLRNPIFNFFDLTSDQPLNPGTDLFIGLNQSEVIQFHWLWSAIVFAMAKPKPEKREPIPKSIKQQYSDGVTLAGSALISLLGQVGRFKCYDLCTFIKTIHEIENLDVKNENMPTGLEYFDLSKRGEEINLGTYVSRAEEISAVNHSNLLFLTSCMGAYGVPQGLPYGQNGVEAFIPPLETEESN